jgi:hypothetical protein
MGDEQYTNSNPRHCGSHDGGQNENLDIKTCDLKEDNFEQSALLAVH